MKASRESEKQTESQHWSLADIVTHTGVSPGQVQQASREGFVSADAGRRYPTGRTLVGLIKFLNGRLGRLPDYDNVQQCSAATGIPVGVIRSARRVAPEAFRNNRIHLGPLLKAIFAERGEEDWRAVRERYEAQTAKLTYERASGGILDKGEVSDAIRRAVSGWWFAYDRLAELELPPALKGCTEEQIRAGLVEAGKRLKNTLEEQLARYCGGRINVRGSAEHLNGCGNPNKDL